MLRRTLIKGETSGKEKPFLTLLVISNGIKTLDVANAAGLDVSIPTAKNPASPFLLRT